MSFNSILSNIGHGFKVFFTDTTKVAQYAEPLIDIAFPGVATLYNLTVNAAVNAENAAITAGAQHGSGAQKLALVIASINADFTSYAVAAGIKYDAATITSWVNAVVATLNSLPAATGTPGVTVVSSVSQQASAGTLL